MKSKQLLEKRLCEIGGLLDSNYCTDDKEEVYSLIAEKAEIEQLLGNMSEEESWNQDN